MSLARHIHEYVTNKIFAEDLYCPITQELMVTPVYYTVNGFRRVFECHSINEWLNIHGTCPITRENIRGITIHQGYDLEDRLSEARYLSHLFLDENGNVISIAEIEKELSIENSKFKSFIVKEFFKAVKSKNIDSLKPFENYLQELLAEKDNDDWSPLHYVAMNGDISMLTYLLPYKPSLEPTTKNGWTPLKWAINNIHVEMASLLLNSGAKIDVYDNQELNIICSKRLSYINNDDLDIFLMIELLLAHGASIQSTNLNHRSAFVSAAEACHPISYLKFLLESGAKINADDSKGNTALHYAANCKNNEEVISFLLSNGADATLKNNKGETPRMQVQNTNDVVGSVYYEQYEKGIILLLEYENKQQNKLSNNINQPSLQSIVNEQQTKINELTVKIEKLEKKLNSTKPKSQMLKDKKINDQQISDDPQKLYEKNKQFELFTERYKQSYYQASFFKKIPASMIKKLRNNTIHNIDEVREYAIEHPNSRTATVLRDLNFKVIKF